MNKNIINFFFSWLLLLFTLNSNAAASYDFPLKSPDGTAHQVSEYLNQGKWVVLNIWGTRCPPCREEIPELVLFHDQHKDDKAIVVGIAIDFPGYGYAKKSEVIEFIDDYLIEFPILLSDSHITKRLDLGQLEGLPTTYLFTPNGDVVGVQVGGITKEIIESFIQRYEKKHERKTFN